MIRKKEVSSESKVQQTECSKIHSCNSRLYKFEVYSARMILLPKLKVKAIQSNLQVC
jgi:hypothetical protein